MVYAGKRQAARIKPSQYIMRIREEVSMCVPVLLKAGLSNIKLLPYIEIEW